MLKWEKESVWNSLNLNHSFVTCRQKKNYSLDKQYNFLISRCWATRLTWRRRLGHHLVPGRYVGMVDHMRTRCKLLLDVFFFDNGHVRRCSCNCHVSAKKQDMNYYKYGNNFTVPVNFWRAFAVVDSGWFGHVYGWFVLLKDHLWSSDFDILKAK